MKIFPTHTFPRFDLPVTKLTKCGALLTAFACLAQPISAEYVLSRTDTDLSSATSRPGAYMHDLTRSGNNVNVGPQITVHGQLPELTEVWGVASANSGRQIVYGAFAENDANFDEIFLVQSNAPCIAQQINPPRNVATQSPFFFSVNTDGPQVVYGMRNLGTNTDTVFLSDVRTPGEGVQIAPDFPNGSLIEDVEIDATGSYVVYRVTGNDNIPQLWITFLQLPANAQRIDASLNAGTDYNPIEYLLTPDGRRMLWRPDRTTPNQPEPLMMVEVDPVARTVSAPIVVNNASNETVFEFVLKTGSNTSVAYRAFVPPSGSPGDTYVVELTNPGTGTQINPAPTAGAAFTRFEDVEWIGDNVFYNTSEQNADLAELFSANPAAPGTSSKISGNASLNPTTTSASVAGVSHFVKNQAETWVGMIDGEPADGYITIDLSDNSAHTPIAIPASHSIGAPGNPNEPMSFAGPSFTGPTFSPSGDFTALRIDRLDGGGEVESRNLALGAPEGNNSATVLFNDNGVNIDVLAYEWLTDAATRANETAMSAAILPTSRSGQQGGVLTAFVTLINGGSVTAEQCFISLISKVQAAFGYQTTDAITNALTGTPDTPVDIAPGAAQSFVISITLNGTFAPTDAAFEFRCANTAQVGVLTGLNTLLVSSSASAVPDIIALAATTTNNGFVELDGSGNGAFSVASVNAGSTSSIQVQGSSTNTNLGINVAMCESNPGTGACINPTAPTFDPVVVNIAANGTPTFSVFVSAPGDVPENAATNRITVEFTEAGTSDVRGKTSVAVRR